MEATRHDNVLAPRPEYRYHRRLVGAPVVPDTAVLADLDPALALNCSGWRTITGFVRLAGGAAPTVTLQQLKLASYRDGAGALQRRYVPTGYITPPLADNGSFALVVGDGVVLLRVHAVEGNPTSVDVLVAGDAKHEGNDADRTVEVLTYLLSMVGSLASLSAENFATEATLLALGRRFAGVKLGTGGQVLGVASMAVRSVQLAEGLWELVADRALWFKQGDAIVAAERGVAGSTYLPAGARRLLPVTAASDDFVSVIAAVDPANDFPSQVDLLNRLKVLYEMHRVLTPGVHAHPDNANAVTAATAVDLATAQDLANDIKTQFNLHRLEDSLLEECCALLTEMKDDYNAHRVLEGGVHGAADGVNVVDAADAADIGTAVTLANQIREKYEAHRVLTDGGVHGAVDETDVVTEPICVNLLEVAALCIDLKAQYEAHRVLEGGPPAVHGAPDNVNAVAAADPGTADVHMQDDTVHEVAAADAADLASLTTLVAELWADYNAHLGDLIVHSQMDQANLLTWGAASLTLEE